ncbi:MAG: hypothetical protein ACOY4W_07295 [Thermodesulfobacteriota bacterium]
MKFNRFCNYPARDEKRAIRPAAVTIGAVPQTPERGLAEGKADAVLLRQSADILEKGGGVYWLYLT